MEESKFKGNGEKQSLEQENDSQRTDSSKTFNQEIITSIKKLDKYNQKDKIEKEEQKMGDGVA